MTQSFSARVLAWLGAMVFTLISPIIDYVAMQHRAKAIVVVVLPLSFMFRQFMVVRDKVYTLLFIDTSPTGHRDRVSTVIQAVNERFKVPVEQRRMMCTARAPWQNLSTRFADYKKNSDCIYVGDLRNPLSVQLEPDGSFSATVEPLVDVATATRWLLPQGFILATTLEVEEATIGGLACAVGMTTASHVHGLLQETVIEYEIILGDGKHVRATRDNEYSDIWHAFPWSHGTIGLLVGLTLKVIKVTPTVRITYHPVIGQNEYCKKIREVSLAEKPADFIEATVFTRTDCVVMEACFVSPSETNVAQQNNVGWWFKPWFYTHVRDVFKVGKRKQEYIPTYQYIFRHNRSIFWTLRDQFPEEIGNHWLFRWTLGWMCPPIVTFLKLPATTEIRKELMCRRVYQDIVLPLSSLEEAINKAGDLFEIWPILIYPTRIYDHGKEMQGQFRQPVKADMVPGKDYAMFYDLGVYGIPHQIRSGNASTYKAVTYMREMEELTRRTGGAPFLYADTFMDREEFGEMFDLSLYERVRKKYNSDSHFPHVFDKTSGCQSFDFKKLLKEEELM